MDETGEVVYYNVFGTFIRGEGGFGGEKGPAAGNEPPDRPPDKVVEAPTHPEQALLYRLSGDINPLHADPGFAAMAGYEKPILHGLCSFGFAGRAVLKEYCDNDPEKFKSPVMSSRARPSSPRCGMKAAERSSSRSAPRSVPRRPQSATRLPWSARKERQQL